MKTVDLILESHQLQSIFIESLQIQLLVAPTEGHKIFIPIADALKIVENYTKNQKTISTPIVYKFVKITPVIEALSLIDVVQFWQTYTQLNLPEIFHEILSGIFQNLDLDEILKYKQTVIELGIRNSELEKELLHWRSLFNN